MGEGEQKLFKVGGSGLGRKPAHGFGEHGGIDLFAVAGDHGVIELIDETHGEESARVDDIRGV